MYKIYIKENEKKFPINFDFNESIKSLIYSYEYIFEKSHKYKITNINNNLFELYIPNHCFFKNNNILLFKNNFMKSYIILSTKKDHIYIYSNTKINDQGFIKLKGRKDIKHLIYKSTILDSTKKLTDYSIKENSIILCY